MGYDIPAWIGEETLVLCSSYSGSTEETVATYDAARAAGAPRIVATTGGPLAERAREDGVPVVPLPGGFQPRAAVGYSLVTALEAAALCGAAPSLRARSRRPPRSRPSWRASGGRRATRTGEAKRLARALHGSIPVITGAGLTASVAYRWKCQVNENAKLPAFASKLPEHDHNEIVGWAGADGRLAAVFLEDPDGDARAARRIDGHRRARGRGRRGRRARHRARRDAPRAAGLARPARRPRLALRRRPARRRPRARGAIDTLKERLAAARA